MDTVHDGSSDKRRILSELSKSLKTVFVEASTSQDNCVQLKINCSLINCIDRSLQHGLINLLNSYWPLVRSCSHTQTLQTIETWLGPESSHRNKGVAWLLATLLEGSLLSYLQCVLAEPHTIVHHYAPHAILRDPSCIAQFSSLLTGLESINFRLEKSLGNESSSFGLEEEATIPMKSVLELPLNNSHGVTGPVMTSSMTSSLASPVDSGFTQLDSETDTASFSEVLLDADSASIKEDVAVLPVDPCVEKTVSPGGASEVMLGKDRGNKDLAPSPFDLVPGSYDDSDEVVYQGKKKKSRLSLAEKHQKRVSFHEETVDVPSNINSQYASPIYQEKEKPSNSFKTSASNLSRAVGDLSSFDSEEEGVEIAGDLSLLGNEGIEELCAQSMVSEMNPVGFTPISQNMSMKTSLTERGTPEGQEDPPKRWSLSTATSDQPSLGVYERQQISNNSSAPSCSSLRSKVSTPKKMAYSSSTSVLSSAYVSSVLSQTPSKACLVKKFLRSITEKKISNCRSATALAALQKRVLSVRKLNLYIHGVSPSEKLSEEVLNELRAEIEDFALKPYQSHPHSNHPSQPMKHILCSHLELSATETIYKVFKARCAVQNADGRRETLLAVVTNQALYILSNRMLKESVLFHSDLSSVLVGPNSQWISLLSKEKAYQVHLLVGEADMVSELVGCIELCLRRKVQKQMDLPAVIHLSYEEFFRICQWRNLVQGERVYHYSVVHALEEFSSCISSPAKPNMKSYFMYRVSETRNSVWQPGFFVLRSGVLYVSSAEEEMSPLFSIDLDGINCRSVSHSSRPHTIEVGNLQIAAPDDFVAHEWLMALQKPSTRINDNLDSDEKLNIINGSLMLTESRVVLMNSLGIPNADLDALGKPFLTALISDVVSFQYSGENSTWCFMEFSCREVHDSGGDFVLFFNTFHEMIAFRDSLWLSCPVLMQECKVLCEKDALYRRCSQVAAKLLADWNFVDCIHLQC